MTTVAERYARFRESVEPELAAKRPPEWDDNHSLLNRARPVPRAKQSWGGNKNGHSPEKNAAPR